MDWSSATASMVPNPASMFGLDLHALNAFKSSPSSNGWNASSSSYHNGQSRYHDGGFVVSEEAVIQTHLAVSSFASSSSSSTAAWYGGHRSNHHSAAGGSSTTNITTSSSSSSSHSSSSSYLHRGLTKEDFDKVFFETFRAVRSSGTSTTTSPNAKSLSYVDLIPNGSNVPVTWSNRFVFAKKLEQFRLTEFASQVAAIATGLTSIVPTPLLSLLSWSELELKVCGRPGLDISLLQKHTVYHSGLSASSRIAKDFWKALASFTPEEQGLFLRFVWGRSRLPSSPSEFGSQRFHLQLLPASLESHLHPQGSLQQQQQQQQQQQHAPQHSQQTWINGAGHFQSQPPQPSSSSSSASSASNASNPHPTSSQARQQQINESAMRLMRLYYSLHGRVADDDLQALLANLDSSAPSSLEQPTTSDSDMASMMDDKEGGAVPVAPPKSPEPNIQTRSSSSSSLTDNRRLPQSRTCFFQLSLPHYSNYNALRSKLLYAITSCREIDTDFLPAANTTPLSQSSSSSSPQTNRLNQSATPSPENLASIALNYHQMLMSSSSSAASSSAAPHSNMSSSSSRSNHGAPTTTTTTITAHSRSTTSGGATHSSAVMSEDDEDATADSSSPQCLTH